MANRPEPTDEPDLTTLVREIAHDAETLIGQQFELLRSELGRDLRQVGGAALTMGAGATLVATGGVLTALTAVHALQRVTRLPLWACYGLGAGLLGALGAGLLEIGRRKAVGTSLLPTQTVEALKENLAWLQDQATPRTT